MGDYYPGENGGYLARTAYHADGRAHVLIDYPQGRILLVGGMPD
ncbi:MAG: hypothetical protein ACRYFV_17745 [Janthinobacterium lividum]